MSDENTIIIPGHGWVTNQGGLKAYKDMVRSISTQIGSMIRQRKTIQQVIDSKPTQEFDASFQGAVIDADTFTSIVYKSLIGRRR